MGSCEYPTSAGTIDMYGLSVIFPCHCLEDSTSLGTTRQMGIKTDKWITASSGELCSRTRRADGKNQSCVYKACLTEFQSTHFNKSYR